MGFLRIKEEYKLREEPNDAIIYNCNIEKILNKIHRIPKAHFGILILMNGQFTEDDLIQMYSENFDSDWNNSKKIIKEIVNMYSEYIEIIENIEIRQNIYIEKNDDIGPQRQYQSFHRLSSPLLLSLVLTYQCNCYCKYCFVNASNKSKKSSLSTETILNIIDEAKSIGIAAINITGGDPFIREDIYIIIKKCIDLNIQINISTKERLSKNEITRLKATGLKEIQISLDTLNNETSKYLTGISNFSDNMIETIKNLIDNNINVIVNSVATKLNIKDIQELIKVLNKIGVKKHFISPYLRTLGRHDDKLFPSELQHSELYDFIDKYDGNMEIDYKRPDYELVEEKKIDDIQRCSGGRMGIVIIPTGDVTICERLLDNPECIVGNIKDNSLLEIWNSNKMINLIEPKKENFINTDCYNCNNFEQCILDKGLCYARTKIAYGGIFNKDPLCPKELNSPKFI